MELKNQYISYPGYFSSEECDKIIEFGKKRLKTATLGPVDVLNEEVRKCEVAWINESWIFERISKAVSSANKDAGWNWFYDTIEPVQFTSYGLNEHYNWHSDWGSDFLSTYNCPNNPDYHGKVRKISATINLVDGNEYDGGNLMFANPKYLHRNFGKNGEKELYDVEDIRSKGSIVIFPSFTYHKVSPVTKGRRYSLVAWVVGKPWQ